MGTVFFKPKSCLWFHFSDGRGNVSEWRTHWRTLIGLFLLTVLVRGGAIAVQPERLNDDIDGYRGIAEQAAAGRGFSNPETGKPTAFRPPLYPLFLAGIFAAGGGNLGIGLLHGILGLGTVFLTWRLGLRLNLKTGAHWAAIAIAIDPLLLQYSTVPMTETLCAFLAVWGLFLITPLPASRWKKLAAGVVLGLCALSRPTFFVFAVPAWAIWVWRTRRSEGLVASPWLAGLGLFLTVLPWGIRNALVLGQFRVTTTHGGYTLLLGNNPVFYREVIEAPWGTTWQGESLASWQASLEEEMKKAQPPVKSEIERDRWLAQRARRNIADQPELFLRSCGLRFVRFWNVLPPDSARRSVVKLWERGCRFVGLATWASAADGVTGLVTALVGLFYGAIFLSFVVGLFRLRKAEWSCWWPLVLMIAAFCAVHLVYWSNTRMRAP